MFSCDLLRVLPGLKAAIAVAKDAPSIAALGDWTLQPCDERWTRVLFKSPLEFRRLLRTCGRDDPAGLPPIKTVSLPETMSVAFSFDLWVS